MLKILQFFYARKFRVEICEELYLTDFMKFRIFRFPKLKGHRFKLQGLSINTVLFVSGAICSHKYLVNLNYVWRSYFVNSLEMKFIFLFSLQFGILWASESPHEQYRWLDSPEGLDPEIGVLLKQGLKIGYLPESYVNGQ